MTRRTPGLLSAQSSLLSLRQQAANPATSSNMSSLPTTTSSDNSSTKKTSSHSSREFVLADMNGRTPRDNRACSSCISKLSPAEVGQVNWHLTEDQPCRLCQVAEGKPEAYTKPFLDFLEENPTIFHTVDYSKKKLHDLGYTEVR